MAQSKNNIVTHGLSGKVGDILVFSQRNGKTIVSKAPKKRKGEDSEKQKQQQAKFQQAVLYGKAVLADDNQKAMYEKEGKKAYNVAVADLLNAPKIESINVSNYKGNTGDTIVIRATDDFKVVSVRVIIQNADGSLVEEGEAVLQGIDWIYTATTQNPDLSGDKIIIQASDIPANVTEKTEILK
ncbi:hypothetical protein [Capnocytophaga canimorsus]|uniref:hypothetical protein n=1 Tax=Capnocytophaga canimorsus TaxID=28188 RepID=UPI001EDD19DA|nr:hypothetical protein [Capnocytophaga canimorsus]GJQ04835.1 hypothetical protein CAPN009_12500 [Capnocytophaga canimorsus]